MKINDTERVAAAVDAAGGELGRVPEWGLPADLKKMKVALHLGYDGSQYKGLQINRATSEGRTVEHFLEAAIFKVGGIRDSNMGDLTKVGWSRASRTDKGVHSLASVVALKMLVPESGGTFVADPEGIQIASSINKHLPNNIRVLSCQRVPKSFRARQQAADRRYEYFLPAWVIGIAGEDADEDARRLKLLREALKSMEGTNAFHNLTSMSQYSKRNNSFRFSSRSKNAHFNRPKPGGDGDVTEQTTGDVSTAATALTDEELSSDDVSSSVIS